MTKPVCLVTGCTENGIGHALALELFSKGCTVYATARRPEAIGVVPKGLLILPLEVTDSKSIASAVDKIISEQGRIDILVNNAGIGCVGPIAEIDINAAKKAFDVNVFGTMAMTQAVVPHMVKMGSGKIVNTGSIVGYISTPFGGVYSSTKAAVHSMTDALRLELAPFGIQVMLVAPGGIKSNFGKNNLERLDSSNLKLYKAYQAKIEERAVISQTGNSTPTALFATKTVEKILSKNVPRSFMYGHNSQIFRILMNLPSWIPDFLLARTFGLDRAAPPPS